MTQLENSYHDNRRGDLFCSTYKISISGGGLSTKQQVYEVLIIF